MPSRAAQIMGELYAAAHRAGYAQALKDALTKCKDLADRWQDTPNMGWRDSDACWAANECANAISALPLPEQQEP
jgi:hypothetical protein